MKTAFAILSLASCASGWSRFQSPNRLGSRLPTRLRQMPDISEKLVFDTENVRFYEQETSDIGEVEEFALIDEDTGNPILLTKEEKERIFLDSLQSYYVTGKALLPDDQFDRLKEDLTWEGSMLVTLNRKENQFVSAMGAYMKGKPVMSDAEFDALKKELLADGSALAVDKEPRCYIDTGICKTTWTVDSVRTSSLYVPATMIFMVFFLGIVYEIPFLRGFNPLIALAIGFAPLATLVKSVTNDFLFKSPLVAGGACPVCAVENQVFFGDVLGVTGDSEESKIKCNNCKTALTVKRNTLRVSTLMPKGADVAASVMPAK